MARITQFTRGSQNRMHLHAEVDCKYFIQDFDGKKLLQLSTYGRPDRQDVGTVSQTFQLDEVAAAELFQILKREFGFI